MNAPATCSSKDGSAIDNSVLVFPVRSSATDHRLSKLEATVNSLTQSFRNLELTFGQHFIAAVQAMSAATSPPAPRDAATPKPKSNSAPSAPSHGDHEMGENTPPVWEFKSSSPAMVVLGNIYSHQPTSLRRSYMDSDVAAVQHLEHSLCRRMRSQRYRGYLQP